MCLSSFSDFPLPWHQQWLQAAVHLIRLRWGGVCVYCGAQDSAHLWHSVAPGEECVWMALFFHPPHTPSRPSRPVCCRSFRRARYACFILSVSFCLPTSRFTFSFPIPLWSWHVMVLLHSLLHCVRLFSYSQPFQVLLNTRPPCLLRSTGWVNIINGILLPFTWKLNAL